MLISDLGKKINDAQLSTQNTLIDLSERMDRMEKGKIVNTAYSTKDLNPNPSVAPTSTTEVEYGMPLNYFAGQTPPLGAVRPHRTEHVRSVPWYWPRHQLRHLRQFRVRLPLAEQMNWRVLYCCTLLNRTANHLFDPPCHKMFGMT